MNCTEIVLAATLYEESIGIARSLTITGLGTTATIIEGLLHVGGFDTVLVLQGLKIQNGCDPEALLTDGGAEILGSNFEVVGSAALPCPPLGSPPLFCFTFDNLCDGIEITQVLPDKSVVATWRNWDCAGATAPMLGGYSGKNVSPRLSWLAADPGADLSTWNFNLNVDARTFDLWVHDTDSSLTQMEDDQPYSVTPGACSFGPEKEGLLGVRFARL